MPRYYGRIGFVDTVETPSGSGIWKEVATERYYMGELVRNTRRWEHGEHLNDDLAINNEVEIVIDEYLQNHFHTLRYLEFAGTFWKISSITVEHPHLRLEIGGVYNKQTSGGASPKVV